MYKTIFIMIYGSGLRVSEAVNLKIEDIDSRKMRIFVRTGKGEVVGGVIGKQEVNQDNLSNLYYLKTINIGAVAGTDNNEKNLKGIDNDFNDLKEFTDWLESNQGVSE